MYLWYKIFEGSKSNNSDIINNYDLSEHEIELISFLAKGLSSGVIAAELFLSKHTIDMNIRNLNIKTRARNAVELLNLLGSN